jgi:hypothetical protein
MEADLLLLLFVWLFLIVFLIVLLLIVCSELKWKQMYCSTYADACWRMLTYADVCRRLKWKLICCST